MEPHPPLMPSGQDLVELSSAKAVHPRCHAFGWANLPGSSPGVDSESVPQVDCWLQGWVEQFMNQQLISVLIASIPSMAWDQGLGPSLCL